jgi:NDP-sugar pyrophosphorylase family protein
VSSTKVLITTSGIGSRLGKLTERTNKSLVKVGDKPVIARIIDSYPNDSEFVITLGYFGNHVREFLEIAYPRLKIVFVEVDKYVGDGSSLAYSLYQARDFIEQPFIFHACDTIVPNFEVPKTIHSWVAGKRGVIGTNYASFDAKGDFVSRFKGKGMLDSDYAYIGIAGIKSPEKFWNCVERILDANHAIENPSDLNILTEMLKEGEQFKVQDIDVWYDTGNSESLQTARRSFQHNETILEKSNESVYFIDHSVIKFSIDSEINRKKVERARFLDGVVPPVTSSSQFFFKYGYVDGQPLSECRDPETIAELLDWSWSHLWSKRLASPSRHFSRD